MKKRLAGYGLAVALAFGLSDVQAMEMEPKVAAESKLTWHGYGELHYNNPKGSDVPGKADPAQMDLHRMLWGLSYQWNDRVSLHTEVDFEHAAKEIELEFAYLDFLIRPEANVRAGVVLMPVGPLNEFHEPPLFYSVERPYIQRTIIPTTWQEGGVGVFGMAGDVKYRFYAVSGLDGGKFTAKDGLRKGRGKVGEAASEDVAFTGRLEYVGVAGLTVGASAYHGGANQTAKDSPLSGVGVSLWEGDIRYRKGGLDLQALYVQVDVDNAEKIFGQTGEAVGEKMVGWNVEAAIHLLPMLSPETDQDLVPFVRYEQFNTQDETPTAYLPDPANDRKVMTVGVAYYPIPDVAVKADWERWENQAKKTAAVDNDGTRFNLGLAYMF